MPKVSYQFEKERLLTAGIIKKYTTAGGTTPDKVAKAIGLSRASYYDRLKSPDKFKVCELRKLYTYLKIPSEERISL